VTPVATCVAATLAAGTAAPDESRTVPDKAAFVDCPKARSAAKLANRKDNVAKRMAARIMTDGLLGKNLE
jgi:hypothetical protein